jgi:hypothetical protein
MTALMWAARNGGRCGAGTPGEGADVNAEDKGKTALDLAGFTAGAHQSIALKGRSRDREGFRQFARGQTRGKATSRTTL